MKDKKKKIGLLVALVLVSGYALYRGITGNIFFDITNQLLHQQVIHSIPDDLEFAGERVHFKSPKAYQRYYKELKLNTSNNQSTRAILRNAYKWMPTIEFILKRNHIPDDFKYIAVVESHLKNDVISPQGAAGIWQFTPSTARALGLKVDDTVDERLDAVKSTKAACKYIKIAHAKFGNWTSAAASYNRGVGGLERAFDKQDVNSYYDLNLNPETAKYIYNILAFKAVISDPEKYGFKIKKKTTKH